MRVHVEKALRLERRPALLIVQADELAQQAYQVHSVLLGHPCEKRVSQIAHGRRQTGQHCLDRWRAGKTTLSPRQHLPDDPAFVLQARGDVRGSRGVERHLLCERDLVEPGAFVEHAEDGVLHGVTSRPSFS